MASPFRKPRIAGRHSFLLSAVRFLRIPLSALGVEFATLHTLLDLRFTIDLRSKAENAKATGGFGGVGTTLIMSLVMGAMFAFLGFGAGDASAIAGVIAASILFYGSFLTLTIFADLLFDRPLETLLATAPIDGRTALAARLLPPAIYLLLIDAGIAIPQILAATLRFGPVAIPSGVITTILASWFAIDASMLVFALALRFVRPERFKVIVVRLQIAITILMMVGPQIFQFGSRTILRHLPTYDLGAWRFFFPPTWYTDLATVMQSKPESAPANAWIGATIAVAAPILAMALALRLAKERFLTSMISSVTEEGLEQRIRSTRGPIRAFVPQESVEKAGFDLCVGLQLRESGSLMRIAPTLVFPLIYMMPFIRGSDGSFSEHWTLLAYGCAATMVPLVYQLRFSDSPLAAWIFDTAPTRVESRLLGGALRASLVRFVLLPGILVALLGFFTSGWSGLLDGATGAAAAVAIGSAIGRGAAPRLAPFSVALDPKAVRGSFGWQLLILALMLTAAGVHRAFAESTMLVLGLFVGWTVLAIVAYRSLSRVQVPAKS